MDPTEPIATTSPALGLSAAEAAARRDRDGPNTIVTETRASRLRRLAGPLTDPMVLLLLVAAPTYLAIGDTTDAVVAFVALVPVIAVGWVLEARAERTLERLREMTAMTAVVVRDGVDHEIPAADVVIGDLLRIREGDVVAADARVCELTQLAVDESSLTGESLAVVKQVADESPDAPEDSTTVWAGTTVQSGSATVQVTAIGRATRYGAITRLLDQTHSSRTPLQRALGRLVRSLAFLAVGFCAAVVTAELVRGSGIGEAVIAGVSLAIAAMPEEFSMVYTLYLALGAWRLTREQALVRRLPTVETLGSTTVICTDKTGTLTEGRLAVAALWTPADGVIIDGSGLSITARDLLTAAVRACEPRSFDALDLAVLDHSAALGIDTEEIHRGELVDDWPFDPAGKYVTHVWRTQPDSPSLAVAAKGAIEGIVSHSRADADTHAAAEAAHTSFTSTGLRVIAVAAGSTDGGTTRAEQESGLSFLGLVAFSDPVRAGVREALEDCRAAGIRVVMITGDHPITAHAVATSLGLPHERGGVDHIATGDELDAADPARLDELAAACNVFARTRPEHKHLLVDSLRRQGEIVAMTGDGVNDAPALREADIGVAMGIRGTAVAREAASIVLLDDNFTTIVTAAREGRRIFDNLTRAIAYLIAFHPPLLIGALVMPLIGRPLLFHPVHLVTLELLLHPVISLVFQADPADPDTMRRPPRPIGDLLHLRGLAAPFALGMTVSAAMVAVYLVALEHWPEDRARAFAFATLLASQPLLLLSTRSPDRPLWSRARPWTPTLRAVTWALVASTVAVVEVGPLARLLRLEAFPSIWWLGVVAVAVVAAAWREPAKLRRVD